MHTGSASSAASLAAHDECHVGSSTVQRLHDTGHRLRTTETTKACPRHPWSARRGAWDLRTFLHIFGDRRALIVSGRTTGLTVLGRENESTKCDGQPRRCMRMHWYTSRVTFAQRAVSAASFLLCCAQGGLSSSVLRCRSSLYVSGTETVFCSCIDHSPQGWGLGKLYRVRNGQLPVHSEQQRLRELLAIIWMVGGGGVSFVFVECLHGGIDRAQIAFRDWNSSVFAGGTWRDELVIYNGANSFEM